MPLPTLSRLITLAREASSNSFEIRIYFLQPLNNELNSAAAKALQDGTPLLPLTKIQRILTDIRKFLSVEIELVVSTADTITLEEMKQTLESNNLALHPTIRLVIPTDGKNADQLELYFDVMRADTAGQDTIAVNLSTFRNVFEILNNPCVTDKLYHTLIIRVFSNMGWNPQAEEEKSSTEEEKRSATAPFFEELIKELLCTPCNAVFDAQLKILTNLSKKGWLQVRPDQNRDTILPIFKAVRDGFESFNMQTETPEFHDGVFEVIDRLPKNLFTAKNIAMMVADGGLNAGLKGQALEHLYTANVEITDSVLQALTTEGGIYATNISIAINYLHSHGILDTNIRHIQCEKSLFIARALKAAKDCGLPLDDESPYRQSIISNNGSLALQIETRLLRHRKLFLSVSVDDDAKKAFLFHYISIVKPCYFLSPLERITQASEDFDYVRQKLDQLGINTEDNINTISAIQGLECCASRIRPYLEILYVNEILPCDEERAQSIFDKLSIDCGQHARVPVKEYKSPTANAGMTTQLFSSRAVSDEKGESKAKDHSAIEMTPTSRESKHP